MLKKSIAYISILSVLINLFLPLSVFAEPQNNKDLSQLKISSSVEDAKIFIDFKDTGLKTPLAKALPLEPGFHSVRVEKKGYTEWRKDILLTEGEILTVNVFMTPLDVSEEKVSAYGEIVKNTNYKKWLLWAVVIAAVSAAASSEEEEDGNGSLQISW